VIPFLLLRRKPGCHLAAANLHFDINLIAGCRAADAAGARGHAVNGRHAAVADRRCRGVIPECRQGKYAWSKRPLLIIDHNDTIDHQTIPTRF
jgi:hypothetical protein